MISSAFGLTGYTTPSNPPFRSWSMSISPKESGVALAPTTATERASSIGASDGRGPSPLTGCG